RKPGVSSCFRPGFCRNMIWHQVFFNPCGLLSNGLGPSGKTRGVPNLKGDRTPATRREIRPGPQYGWTVLNPVMIA
ncbi:MAG: hypothetical protein ABI453_04745, partial [Isosphaeraceae bacterium]